MKQAHKKDALFISEVEKACSEKYSDDFFIWWLGQSGFLIVWKGRKLLLDPYLSDSLTKKYAHTDKPHVRMTERVIDPADLPEIDIVTSSHNHTDHLDAETLKPILETSPKADFIIPEANRAFVCDRVGCPLTYPIGFDIGDEIRIKDFTFHAVPAAHNEIERDHLGRRIYLGYVIRFGPWSLYHSGDTRWYDGMEAVLKPFQLNCALLPINGYDPDRRVAGNLNGREAAELAKNIDVGVVIPHHYDMFEFNTADPEWFRDCCESIGQPYHILRVGECLRFRA